MMRWYKLTMQVAGPYASQFRLTLLCSLLAALLQALSWAIMIPLFQTLLQGPDFPLMEAMRWLAMLALLLAGEALLRLKEMAFTYDYWHRVTEDVRLRLASTLRTIPLEQLARRKSGDLALVLGSNVTMAATAISSLATLFVQLTAVPAVLLTLVFWLDWRLGTILLVALLWTLPLLRQVQKRANRDFQHIDEADARAGAGIVEYVQGLAMLRAAGSAGPDAPCLSGLFEHQHQMQAASQTTVQLLAKAQLIVQLALVALVAAAIGLTVSGQLSLAALLSVTVITAHLAEPLSMGLAMVRLFELADAALNRTEQILNQPPLVTRQPQQQPNEFSLTLNDVTFHYDRRTEPAIRGFSLHIPARSLTALIGPSGGGKTTITRLIGRFADPQQGSVLLGDSDLRHVPPETLLQYISVVFQDVWLFDDSIANNIALGKPGASLAEIVSAAQKAHIHHVIERLPQGYNTRTGEAGHALSGGERQRISIARAILKDAPVILLDEPTSALDSESEYHVQQAIEALVQDKTVVIVAHRLSTIRAADQIAFIEQGRCVELGNHEALMAMPAGRYRQMVMAQQVPSEETP